MTKKSKLPLNFITQLSNLVDEMRKFSQKVDPYAEADQIYLALTEDYPNKLAALVEKHKEELNNITLGMRNHQYDEPESTHDLLYSWYPDAIEKLTQQN